MNRWIILLAVACLVTANVGAEKEKPKVEKRLYEMRTYYANDGKMKALHARFRDHTCKLFLKHGMEIVGFWSSTDEKVADQEMVYILAHKDKAAAEKSWAAFVADPDWIKAKTASEKDGKLVKDVKVLWLNGTDYSPLK